MEMETGDVVFFRAQDTWISKLISKLTKSEYTHVGLALDNFRIIEADRFVNTRIVKFEYDEKIHSLYRSKEVDDTMKEKIYTKAILFEKYPYDYFQIFQWLFRFLFGWNVSIINRANRLICSELIDYTFIASGMTRSHHRQVGDVTPGMLIELYKLEEVKGG